MRYPTVLVLLLSMIGLVHADEISDIRSVGDHAENTAAARSARDALVAGGRSNLLPVLKAFDGSSMLAQNWLRSAFESIADAEIKAGRSLPKQDLIAFIKETSRSAAARRLAYEWLLKRSPELEQQLIPQMLTDPGPEFRRDAVAQLIEAAQDASGDQANALYRRALQGAVHEDQVKTIATALEKAGESIDIQRHFGFLPAWHVIGPFDNREMKGYAIAYPPEQNIDLSAEYDGQLGKVTWQRLETDDDYGVVDIAKELENHKGSLMYATATYRSPEQQTVEFRLGTPNAWKLWLNGRLIFEREEYHRSTRMDQYKIPVTLQPGTNTVLLKVCQNEQTQPWAQKYQFQLRVCNESGAAVLPVTQAAFRN